MNVNNVNEAFTENVDDLANIEQTGIVKLSRDLRNASANLTPEEARYLVDYYYQIQNDRIRAKNRLRAFSEGKEPHETITWLSDNTAYLEKQIAAALLAYAKADFVGKWALSVIGIGGVLSAGLLAHIDINKANTVGHIYSFAGIAPNGKEWKKGEQRPFNADLKTLCWKIGESFVKTSNNKNDFYGKVYQHHKALLIADNEKGRYAFDAAVILEKKKIGKTTDAYAAYSSGKLPPAHIHARAKRKAIYLFLSHFWEVSYRYHFPEKTCPRPYIIEHGGHTDYIPIHNNPF